MPTPHDALFKFTFANPEHARDLIRALLPKQLAEAIDWESLRSVPGSFVDKHLAQHHTDLLFTCRIAGHEVLIYVLIEHRSGFEAHAPLDVGRYVLRAWDDWVRHHGGRVPPVIPLIVYHGREPWPVRRDLLGLVDFDGLPPAIAELLAPWQPNFTFVVDDLAAVTPEQLAQRNLSALAMATLALMQRLRFVADPTAEVLRLREVLRAVATVDTPREALHALFSYVFAVAKRLAGPTDPPSLIRVLRDIASPNQDLDMTTYADFWRQEGEAIGEARGEARGKAIGEAQGEARGEAKGRISVLRRLLELRFGPLPEDASQRLDTAPIDDLDAWTERTLTAPSLADVFA